MKKEKSKGMFFVICNIKGFIKMGIKKQIKNEDKN